MPMADLRYQRKRRNIESLIEHTESFKIEPQFITRPWTFNAQEKILHDTALTLKQRMNITAELVDYGLTGIEVLYPQEINEKNITYFQDFARENSLKINSVVLDFSLEAIFLHGALSSSNRKIRELACERLKMALELNDELETDYALIIINTDGYETAFGVDLVAARDRFTLALVDALDANPDVRIALQTTPARWHQRHLFYGTAEILLLCQKIESLLTHSDHRERFIDGHAVTTIIPNFNYLTLLGEDPTSSLSLILETARLSGLCFNYYSQGSHGFFEPAVDTSFFTSALYALKMVGFRECFCVNVCSYTVSPDQALKNAIDHLRANIAFVNYLDDDKIILSHQDPKKNKGWLDAYLIRAASPQGEALPPIDFFQI